MHVFKGIHIIVGVLGIVIFVLTGQYMAIFLQGMLGMADAPRLMYRTSHLYLMWASLVNLLVGVAYTIAASKGARIVQAVSSVAILLGPILMLASFALESRNSALNRPFSDMGNYLALGGVILFVGATYLKRRSDG